MNKFKKDDIVQYVKGNNEWVKACLKFKVTGVGAGWINVISLQDIPRMSVGNQFKQGDIIYKMETYKFELVHNRKNHLPKWF